MKNTMRVLFGVLIGTIVGTLVYGDNLEKVIKVSTMQVDTVYSTYTTKIEIDTDTIRTIRKDGLVIITGVKQHTVDYNVEKSEWIDSILLTKPKRYHFNGWRLYVYYDDFYMYEYLYSRDYVFIKNYDDDWVLYHHYNLGKNDKASVQTEKNVKTVMNRYWYIVTN